MQHLAARHKEEEEEPIANPTIQKSVPINENLEIEEQLSDINRQVGDFSVYKYYFGSIGLPATLVFAFFIILAGGSQKMPEFLLTYWTQAVAVHGNEVNARYMSLWGALAVICTIGFAGGVCQLALFMVPKSAKILHERLLDTVMGAPLSFFSSTDTGTTTNRQVLPYI